MIKLKPKVFIPLEVGGLNIELDTSTFFGSDAVFSIDLKKRILHYKGFWRGAGLGSITIFGDVIVAGTKNGIIIFGEKALAHWTGSKTAVFSGNFSKNVKFIPLAFYKERGRRYLRVFPLDRSYLEGESRKLYSEVIVSFFTPFGGPMDYELIRYLYSLTNVFDVDGEGYDELVLINFGVDSAYIVIISVKEDDKIAVDIKQEKLPNYTFRPIMALSSDVDKDGLQEIILLSNPKYGEYHISMIDIVNGNIITQSIDALNPKKIFKGVSEDGEAWFSVGDLDGDGFVEISFLWEEKPEWGGIKSKLFALTKTFFGETRTTIENLEIYPPLQIFTWDYDGDGKDELISVSSLGLEVINLDKGVVETFLPIIGDVRYLFHLGGESFFILGSVLEDIIWSYYSIENFKITIGQELPPIIKALRCEKDIVLLDSNKKVLLISDGVTSTLKNSVVDIKCIKKDLYLLLENGSVIRYNLNKHKEKLERQNVSSLADDGSQVFFIRKEKNKLLIEDSKGIEVPVKLPLIKNIESILLSKLNNEKIISIINTHNTLQIYNERGELISIVEGLKIQQGNFLRLRRGGKELLLFIYNKALYSLDFNKPEILSSLGYRGWQTLASSMDSNEEIFVIFENGIYSVNVEEVIEAEE